MLRYLNALKLARSKRITPKQMVKKNEKQNMMKITLTEVLSVLKNKNNMTSNAWKLLILTILSFRLVYHQTLFSLRLESL